MNGDIRITPPDCPGCGKLWTELPANHWWRLNGYRYQCIEMPTLYPGTTATRKETT